MLGKKKYKNSIPKKNLRNGKINSALFSLFSGHPITQYTHLTPVFPTTQYPLRFLYLPTQIQMDIMNLPKNRGKIPVFKISEVQI